MRVWSLLMATFLILMVAFVLLLGSFDCLKKNYPNTLNHMDSTLIAQEVCRPELKTLPCPWQLDFITPRAGENIINHNMRAFKVLNR